jgi:magnesium transporter
MTTMLIHTLHGPGEGADGVSAPECIELTGDMTVAEAFAYIQAVGGGVRSIYTCYVVDGERRLVGVVSAKDLLLADSARLVADIMEPDFISAQVDDDQEETMADIVKYGFMEIPVVDAQGRLVSIFTFDEAFAVQDEEATEDFEKMAAISPSEIPYLSSGIFALARHRIPWLFLLMVFASLTGLLVELFEDSLAVLPALVAFVPMLMNTGGNAGTQSSTMIIRGMALGDIELPDFYKVLGKEAVVSLLCGVILVVTTFVSALTFGEGARLAVTVCLAMMATIIMSNIIGGLLTFLAKAVKVDPAVMAAPLLTNIIDALSLLVYFSLARLILGI